MAEGWQCGNVSHAGLQAKKRFLKYTYISIHTCDYYIPFLLISDTTSQVLLCPAALCTCTPLVGIAHFLRKRRRIHSSSNTSHFTQVSPSSFVQLALFGSHLSQFTPPLFTLVPNHHLARCSFCISAGPRHLQSRLTKPFSPASCGFALEICSRSSIGPETIQGVVGDHFSCKYTSFASLYISKVISSFPPHLLCSLPPFYISEEPLAGLDIQCFRLSKASRLSSRRFYIPPSRYINENHVLFNVRSSAIQNTSIYLSSSIWPPLLRFSILAP
jgi:hypothetical protein